VMWSGFFGPKGTSQAIADKVARDVQAVVNDPAVKKQIETTLTGTVQQSSPSQFAAEYRDEAVVWKNLIQTLKIQPE